jgi:hypothetical protein
LKLTEANTNFLDKHTERQNKRYDKLLFNTEPDWSNADWEKAYDVRKIQENILVF